MPARGQVVLRSSKNWGDFPNNNNKKTLRIYLLCAIKEKFWVKRGKKKKKKREGANHLQYNWIWRFYIYCLWWYNTMVLLHFFSVLSTYRINTFSSSFRKTPLNDYYHLARPLLGYKHDFDMVPPLKELLMWYTVYCTNSTM